MTSESSPYRRVRITDQELELLRPVIAAWSIDGESVSPDAFKLSSADKKDNNRLSINRGSATTAEQAYEDRAKAIKERCEFNGREFIPPAGVLGITVKDVESIQGASPADSEGDPRSVGELSVWDDSENDGVSDDHGHIDYNEIPPTDRGLYYFVAKTLTGLATWRFRPGSL